VFNFSQAVVPGATAGARTIWRDPGCRAECRAAAAAGTAAARRRRALSKRLPLPPLADRDAFA
jgi:hypothetical protein